MQYDPIKRKLGSLAGRSVFLRKMLYSLLDILLLRSWHVRRLLRKMAPSMPQNAIVLDAGAGFGQYSYRMARLHKNWKVTAIDLKEEQVTDCNLFFQAAGMGNRVRFITGDLTELTDENNYDLILSVDVMEHIENDRQVFTNLLRALKPGGSLVISTPSDRGGSDVHNEYDKSFIDEHVRDGYNIDDLSLLLLKTGFSDVETSYTYGRAGSAAWRISMKYPVKMLGVSGISWLVLPFYYIIVMPLAMILNYTDVNTRNRSGTGLLIRAVK
ncbi:MAG: class I SAM-dependent methyltransferase [Bacteroidetes bacterium]|nr:class I SAM-dependent methyltransferase [Bacteroidota bacterium]